MPYRYSKRIETQLVLLQAGPHFNRTRSVHLPISLLRKTHIEETEQGVSLNARNCVNYRRGRGDVLNESAGNFVTNRIPRWMMI